MDNTCRFAYWHTLGGGTAFGMMIQPYYWRYKQTVKVKGKQISKCTHMHWNYLQCHEKKLCMDGLGNSVS